MVEYDEQAASNLLAAVRNAVEHYAGMETIVVDEQWKASRSKTVLNLHGQSLPESFLDYLLCQTTTEKNQGKVPEGTLSDPRQKEHYHKMVAAAFQTRATMRAHEVQVNARLTGELYDDPTFPEGWSGTVRFNRWRDTPACPCCGWNLETGRQLGVEELLRGFEHPEIQGMAFTRTSPIVNASRERIPIRFPWDPDASLHRKLLADEAEARGDRR